MNQDADTQPSDEAHEAVLDDAGGVPAVAVGTSREQAEQRPAAVRDSAVPDVPDVAAGTEEEEAHSPRTPPADQRPDAAADVDSGG